MLKLNIDQWDSTYPNKGIISQDLNNGTYFIAVIKDEIIAGINIDKIQDKTYLSIKWDDTENKFLVVHRLGIKEEYWSQGVGKILMDFAEDMVKKNKLNSIRLDTYNSNKKAIKFYTNLGYKKLGTIFLKPNKNEYYCFEKLI
jgi:ribosomal protein S18 acetylase RimI-like enzyme